MSGHPPHLRVVGEDQETAIELVCATDMPRMLAQVRVNSSEETASWKENAQTQQLIDAATDDILERYKGRWAELARIAGCEYHTVNRWGPNGLSRPKPLHMANMARRDAKYRAMIACAFGFDIARPPELEAAFDHLLTVHKATEIVATVTHVINGDAK